MSSSSSHPGALRALIVLFAALAATLVFAASSQAAETIYWSNYEDGSVGFANPDGSGGGALNLAGAELSSSEGDAYDTVTNRLFVASEGSDKIVAVNLDGSGASYFSAPGAPVDNPEGIVVDPDSRTVFWINTGDETISWARLDGSIGGVVDTGGVDVDAYRLSLDPVAKRLYWFDEGVDNIVSVSMTGGTVTPLNTSGATPGSSSGGVAVEPALGKVFWIGHNEEFVSWARLDGTGGGDIPVGEPAMDDGYGLALDAAAGRAYWANYLAREDRANALGFVNLSGGYAPINVLTAPVNGPQDPVLLKTPRGTGVPAVSGVGTAPAALACSTGSWAADAPGAFVYQAPRSYAYQWALNGAAIPGATAATLAATQPGNYTCTVTATNQAGTASQTSAAAAVAPAPVPAPASLTAKLKTKKPQAKAGKVAVVKVTLSNAGGTASAAVSVCGTLNKKAKKGLVAPKCAKVGALAPGASSVAKLRVKTKPAAKGTYKLTVKVKGTALKPITVGVKVIAAKKHKKGNGAKKQGKKHQGKK